MSSVRSNHLNSWKNSTRTELFSVQTKFCPEQSFELILSGQTCFKFRGSYVPSNRLNVFYPEHSFELVLSGQGVLSGAIV